MVFGVSGSATLILKMKALMVVERSFSPEELMEWAIEVMLQSVAEPRNDCKARPPNAPFTQCTMQKAPEPDWPC
jgi:hypothetical protein